MYTEKYLYMYDLDYVCLPIESTVTSNFISLAIILFQDSAHSYEVLITLSLKICIFHICIEI